MDPGLAARMNECSDLVRSLDGLLGRLEKHFRTALDSSQLAPKQSLLDSVSDSFQLLDKLKLGAEGAEPRVAATSRLRTSSANPVTAFKTAADALTMKYRMKILSMKRAMGSESTNPAQLVQDLLPALKSIDTRLSEALTRYESTNMEVETYFSLTVKVHEAKGLPATDLRSEGADSYVELFVDGRKKARTRTIWKTKNPCWSQDFYVYVAKDASAIEMKVFDESSGLVDSFLGQIVVPMNRLRDGAKVDQEWFPLVGESIGHCGPQSKIRLQIEYKKGYSRHIGHLQVKILEGSRIVGDGAEMTPSAFVEVETIELVPFGTTANPEEESKEKPFRTSTVRKNNNPKWNESSQIKVIWGENTHLKFTVVDTALKGKEKFLGEGFLNLAELIPNRGEDVAMKEMWLHLTPKPATEQRAGQLRVSLNFREEKVLPDVGYEELLECVLSDNLAVPTLLGHIASNVPEKKEVFRNLMSILELKGKSVAIVTALIRKEIDNTKDLTVLFRGNSIATVAVDVFMQVVGGHLLEQTLRETIQKIYIAKQPFEIDPDRADEIPDGLKFDPKKNLDALLDALNEVWSKIQENSAIVPSSLRQVLGNIRYKVKERWPTEDTAHYTCVTAFLFLRFFSAAILGPQLFGLVDRTRSSTPAFAQIRKFLLNFRFSQFLENPSQLVLRNLTLVSKILMNLANLVLFGKKEPHMGPVNDWVQSNLLKMRKYVDSVAKPTTDRVNAISGPPLQINYGRQMSFIHRYLSVKRPSILSIIETHSSASASQEDSEDSESSGSYLDADSSDDENMIATYTGAREPSPRPEDSSPMLSTFSPTHSRKLSADFVQTSRSAPDMTATLPPPLTTSAELLAPLPPPIATDSISSTSSSSVPTIPPLPRAPSGSISRPEKSPLVSVRVREARSSSVLRRRSAKEMAKNLLKEVDDASVVRSAVAATLSGAAGGSGPIRRSSGTFVPHDVYVPALKQLVQVLDRVDLKTGDSTLPAVTTVQAHARARSPSLVVYTK